MKGGDRKGKMPMNMGSHGGGSGSGSVQPQSHELRSNALAMQGSLNSLTLDEIQNQLGDLVKPLASMTLDELFETAWSAESSQGTGGVDYGASSQHDQVASRSSLQQQSSVTPSRYLSLDELLGTAWSAEISQGTSFNLDSGTQERQAALDDEMTLEDLLVELGVVAKKAPRQNDPGWGLGVDPIALPQQPAQWTNNPFLSVHQSQHQQQNIVPVFMPGHSVQLPLPIGVNPMMNFAYPEFQMRMPPTALMGTLSNMRTPGTSIAMKKSAERRLKRKLKNRELAARTRARKKAYTNELENKVSRLEEENERLKRRKEMEKLLPSVPTPKPKYQLRRTSSASF